VGVFELLRHLQNRLVEAEDVWEKALQANPGQSWPLVELGRMYEEMGAVLKAREAFFRATELNPQDATANQKLEQSAAAVAAWQIMNDYVVEQAASGQMEAPAGQVTLINQRVANGWTHLGYIADEELLYAGKVATIWNFWRAPTPAIKPSLEPEQWLPVRQTYG